MSEAQNAWVGRVLGVTPSKSGASAGGPQDSEQPAVGLVAYRKALLGFRSAIADVNGQLSIFVDRLEGELPEEAELGKRLTAELNRRCEALNDQIDSGIGAPTDGRTAENEKTQRAVAKLIAKIRSDKLIALIDSNPLLPTTISATLSSALTQVAQTIV